MSSSSPNAFNRIGLIGRKNSAPVIESINKLCNSLHQRNCEILVEEKSSVLIKDKSNIKTVSDIESLASCCDLAIVVGGDGSMLAAARILCEANIPVLGINRGELGFLTDISSDEIEGGVNEVLDGKYSRDERFLLEAVISRNDSVIKQADAMNELVVHRGASLKMIEFALYINEQFVYSQRSDGLIVSTPTGSTAYALSGGGPILHPAMDAISLVPMFPHTLTSRPIVIGGDSEIKVVVGDYRGGEPELSCDGQNHFVLQSGDTINIQKKSATLSLIHPDSYNYYETCRSKLGWGSRLS